MKRCLVAVDRWHAHKGAQRLQCFLSRLQCFLTQLYPAGTADITGPVADVNLMASLQAALDNALSIIHVLMQTSCVAGLRKPHADS